MQTNKSLLHENDSRSWSLGESQRAGRRLATGAIVINKMEAIIFLNWTTGQFNWISSLHLPCLYYSRNLKLGRPDLPHRLPSVPHPRVREMPETGLRRPRHCKEYYIVMSTIYIIQDHATILVLGRWKVWSFCVTATASCYLRSYSPLSITTSLVKKLWERQHLSATHWH